MADNEKARAYLTDLKKEIEASRKRTMKAMTGDVSILAAHTGREGGLYEAERILYKHFPGLSEPGS